MANAAWKLKPFVSRVDFDPHRLAEFDLVGGDQHARARRSPSRLMRQGMEPQRACEEVVHRIARLDPRGYALDICFIALDKRGRYGAAASNQSFPLQSRRTTRASCGACRR